MNLRPYVLLKLACSLDGFIDDNSNKRYVFSSKEDAQAVDELRASVDGILIGAETLRRDDPTLTVKTPKAMEARRKAGFKGEPSKIVLTCSGNIPFESRFFSTGSAEKYIYVAKDKELAVSNKIKNKAFVCGLSGTLLVFLNELAARGVKRLLVEGGTKIAEAFLKEKLVDEVRLAIAPVVFAKCGGASLPDNLCLEKGMKIKSAKNLGGTLVLKYYCN